MKRYKTRLAKDDADIIAAQKLRYRVFVQELGAKVSEEDHALCQERDLYDPLCDHLLLIDLQSNDVVGVYRLLKQTSLPENMPFYSASEFDLTPLLNSGQNMLELGRSCIHPDHRGGDALQVMWMGLGQYVVENQIDLMFGTASFHGTDVQSIAQPLSCLHYFFRAAEPLCPVALPHGAHRMDVLEKEHVNRPVAMSEMPPLIKGYLRLGGKVGANAFVDQEFNTIDVLIMIQTDQISEKYHKMYGYV
jgi:putative hemolysin